MNFLFLLTWFAASAGTAKLLAICENVLHGYGWKRSTLQRVRATHNVLLFGYPVALMVATGVMGPKLLWNTDWSKTCSVGWGLLAIGAVGFVLLLASTLRYCTHRPPACQVAETSDVIDIGRRAEGALIGGGRAKWLARLPLNQQFTVEVVQRTYVLPRLPAAWNGVSLVHFSDCHFRGPVTREYFEQVMSEVQKLQPDLIVFTGDLLDHKSCLQWIPTTLGTLSAPLGCYFILGNHDWYVGIEPQIRSALTGLGWIDASGRVIELRRDGIPLVICGNERPWMGAAPDLSAVPGDTFRVLLSHSPDRIDWAQANRIDLMLAGHTHGGQSRLPISGPVYSPSIYSCRYASGVFLESPTLMSVTRGVSGREPIRYNCRPEIVKLTLHRALESKTSPQG